VPETIMLPLSLVPLPSLFLPSYFPHLSLILPSSFLIPDMPTWHPLRLPCDPSCDPLCDPNNSVRRDAKVKHDFVVSIPILDGQSSPCSAICS